MLEDIKERQDIKLLVDSFYKKVLDDEVIGYIFTDVVKLDWAHHIPTMYNFWETTLLHKAVYKGNPMQVHLELNKKEQLKPEHFDRWLKLFSETIDIHFKGQTADLAKTRALSIATMMQVKIFNAKNQ